MIRTLGETLATHNTQLDLALILIQGVREARANPNFEMNPNNREPVFRALVNSQNRIGWQHLIKGRFSKQWTQIQGRHILDESEIDQEKQSADRWLKIILHHIWTHLWQLWLARNEDLLHGKEKDEQERKRLEKLHPRIIALYSKVDLLLACDKPIFDLPILERMKLHSTENWKPG